MQYKNLSLVLTKLDGQILRLRIPDLTEERRKDLIKILKNMGEKAKFPQEILEEKLMKILKKLKEKNISEDDNKIFEKSIQKLTT